MDELERWELKREVFRKWLGGLEFNELLQVSEDVRKMLDYMSRRIERQQTKDEFLKIIEGL